MSLKSLLDDACPSLTTSTTALPEEGEERNYGEALLPSGLLQETPVLSPSSEQEGKAAADPKREEGTSVTQERRESSHSSFTSAEERLQQELRRRGEAVDKQTTANDEEDENSTRHHSTGADTDSTAASSSCITPNGRTASAMLTTILKQVSVRTSSSTCDCVDVSVSFCPIMPNSLDRAGLPNLQLGFLLLSSTHLC